jgi:hypothetical protein
MTFSLQHSTYTCGVNVQMRAGHKSIHASVVQDFNHCTLHSTHERLAAPSLD